MKRQITVTLYHLADLSGTVLDQAARAFDLPPRGPTSEDGKKQEDSAYKNDLAAYLQEAADRLRT